MTGRLSERHQLWNTWEVRRWFREAGCPAPALGWLFSRSALRPVPDLGMDAVVTYRVDGVNHRLLPSHRNSMVPGGGPRHEVAP